jgi:hypothetical protein
MSTANKVIVFFYLGDSDYFQEMNKRDVTLAVLVDSFYYRCGEIGFIQRDQEIVIPTFNDAPYLGGVYFSDFIVLPCDKENTEKYLNNLKQCHTLEIRSSNQVFNLGAKWNNKPSM